jgi:hypothetical protein
LVEKRQVFDAIQNFHVALSMKIFLRVGHHIKDERKLPAMWRLPLQ